MALLDPRFVDVQYDGYVLSGIMLLYAMADVYVPHVLDWRNLNVQKVWPCDSVEEVAERLQVDYASVNEEPKVLFLREGDFYGRRKNFPIFGETYMPQGGPECIRYEIVYAPDGQFRGSYTLSIIGKVSKGDKPQLLPKPAPSDTGSTPKKGG
ncbi:hypothetical protein ACN28E_23570 [Archangium lansingense]|uniref:hypothetical protein n=1 Tax=Archangium lansingense TaxID=2995310 RepID=UPI003B81A336